MDDGDVRERITAVDLGFELSPVAECDVKRLRVRVSVGSRCLADDVVVGSDESKVAVDDKSGSSGDGVRCAGEGSGDGDLDVDKSGGGDLDGIGDRRGGELSLVAFSVFWWRWRIERIINVVRFVVRSVIIIIVSVGVVAGSYLLGGEE